MTGRRWKKIWQLLKFVRERSFPIDCGIRFIWACNKNRSDRGKKDFYRKKNRFWSQDGRISLFLYILSLSLRIVETGSQIDIFYHLYKKNLSLQSSFFSSDQTPFCRDHFYFFSGPFSFYQFKFFPKFKRGSSMKINSCSLSLLLSNKNL